MPTCKLCVCVRVPANVTWARLYELVKWLNKSTHGQTTILLTDDFKVHMENAKTYLVLKENIFLLFNSYI